MTAKNVELVAISNGHGRFLNEIDLTQLAFRLKCKGLITR